MAKSRQSEDIQVDINPELFNNVYWHLLDAFDDLRIRFIWLFGGSSAGKTYSVVQLQIVKNALREHRKRPDPA